MRDPFSDDQSVSFSEALPEYVSILPSPGSPTRTFFANWFPLIS